MFVNDTRVFFISKRRPAIFQDKPYPVTSPSLGFAVIVNNVPSEIPDSVEDLDVLSRSLQTMGYTTKSYSDCNVETTDSYSDCNVETTKSYSDCNVQVTQPIHTVTAMLRQPSRTVTVIYR